MRWGGNQPVFARDVSLNDFKMGWVSVVRYVYEWGRLANLEGWFTRLIGGSFHAV
jgi:hypothetical protein